MCAFTARIMRWSKQKECTGQGNIITVQTKQITSFSLILYDIDKIHEKIIYLGFINSFVKYSLIPIKHGIEL